MRAHLRTAIVVVGGGDTAMEEAHYLVVGQYKAFGAYRKDSVNGWLQGPAAVFWNP